MIMNLIETLLLLVNIGLLVVSPVMFVGSESTSDFLLNALMLTPILINLTFLVGYAKERRLLLTLVFLANTAFLFCLFFEYFFLLEEKPLFANVKSVLLYCGLHLFVALRKSDSKQR